MRTMCPDAERLVKRLAARTILPAVPATMLARDPRKNKIAEASTRPRDRPSFMPDNSRDRRFCAHPRHGTSELVRREGVRNVQKHRGFAHLTQFPGHLANLLILRATNLCKQEVAGSTRSRPPTF